jgi:hypothetical protein
MKLLRSLYWNEIPQAPRSMVILKKTSKRMIEKEALEMGKVWAEIKRMVNN